MIEASIHAVDRYIERVEPVSREEARARLTTDHIGAMARFGAKHIKLEHGHRALIRNGIVVTVLPPMTRQCSFKRLKWDGE